MTRAILIEETPKNAEKGGVRAIRLRQGEREVRVEARVVLAADGLAGQFLAHARTAVGNGRRRRASGPGRRRPRRRISTAAG